MEAQYQGRKCGWLDDDEEQRWFFDLHGEVVGGKSLAQIAGEVGEILSVVRRNSWTRGRDGPESLSLGVRKLMIKGGGGKIKGEGPFEGVRCLYSNGRPT